jgi:hypothetical protein
VHELTGKLVRRVCWVWRYYVLAPVIWFAVVLGPWAVPKYVTERLDYHRACYISNMAILQHVYTYIYLSHAFLFRQSVHTNGRLIANDAAIPPSSIKMTAERAPKVIAMATWGHLNNAMDRVVSTSRI